MVVCMCVCVNILWCRHERQILVGLHPHAHLPTAMFHSILGTTRDLLQVTARFCDLFFLEPLTDEFCFKHGVSYIISSL